MDDEETFERGKALAMPVLDTVGQQRSGEMLMAIAFLAAGRSCYLNIAPNSFRHKATDTRRAASVQRN